MGVLVTVGQLILSLSILIVLHEFGHFLPARWFKTRVEKFYLFFDAWFSLFKYKIGETEYGIGWLPLGGYVKIAGMIDESMDLEQMKQPPQPWEFRSKPAWQRLIIMLGGVTVNFILGFLIFGLVFWKWGVEYLPNDKVEYGIYVDSIGQDLGLMNGDIVLKAGDKEIDRVNDRLVVKEIVINGASSLTVRRDGKEVELPVDKKYITELSSYKNKGNALYFANFPFIAKEFSSGSPAEEAGMKVDDRIIALDGTPTPFYYDFTQAIKGKENQAIQMSVLRNQKDTVQLNFTTTENAKIKVYAFTPTDLYGERQSFTLGEAMPYGFNYGVGFLGDQIKAFGKMFTGQIKATESMGGFGSIAQLFPSHWNWEIFWKNTAILSLILAFMNLLPIPALDGGHVMFLLYEVITGRKPSDKFLEYSTIFGFILVLALLIFANGLDFLRWWNS